MSVTTAKPSTAKPIKLFRQKQTTTIRPIVTHLSSFCLGSATGRTKPKLRKATVEPAADQSVLSVPNAGAASVSNSHCAPRLTITPVVGLSRRRNHSVSQESWPRRVVPTTGCSLCQPQNSCCMPDRKTGVASLCSPVLLSQTAASSRSAHTPGTFV